MSTDTDTKTEARNRFFRIGSAAVAAVPAAFLTWLGSSLGKNPSDFVRECGFTFPWFVLIASLLLALAFEEGVRSYTQRARDAVSAAAIAVSFISSILLFVGIMYFFVG